MNLLTQVELKFVKLVWQKEIHFFFCSAQSYYPVTSQAKFIYTHEKFTDGGGSQKEIGNFSGVTQGNQALIC